MDQDPLGKQAVRVSQIDTQQIYAKDMEDGSKAVGLFNVGYQDAQMTVNWQDLGIGGRQIVRDLWKQTDLGAFDEKFQVTVPHHGVVLVKIRQDTK